MSTESHLDVQGDGEPDEAPLAKPWWSSFEEDGQCALCGGRNDRHARWCEMRKHP